MKRKDLEAKRREGIWEKQNLFSSLPTFKIHCKKQKPILKISDLYSPHDLRVHHTYQNKIKGNKNRRIWEQDK